MARPNSLRIFLSFPKDRLVGGELGGEEAGGDLSDEVAVEEGRLHDTQLIAGPVELVHLQFFLCIFSH